MEQDQTHKLYEREGRSPPPLDDKILSIPESILKHHLAVPPEEFLEQLINPHTRKLDHCYEGLYTMFDDDETNESVPDIPLDREKKKEPPKKNENSC